MRRRGGAGGGEDVLAQMAACYKTRKHLLPLIYVYVTQTLYALSRSTSADSSVVTKERGQGDRPETMRGAEDRSLGPKEKGKKNQGKEKRK